MKEVSLCGDVAGDPMSQRFSQYVARKEATG